MHAFSIPWPCLDASPNPHHEPKNPPKINKTFAQALSNVCDIPMSQFPPTSVKGASLAVEIPEEEYLAGMNACKHNLHGRIIWPKGTTPLSVVDLKKKLSVIWKDLSRWGITSLGKGYYEFCFSSLEDVRRVRSVVSWNINPGFLKLFAWSGDFNPSLQRNTSAQVWVRIYGLSQEYWRPKILFAIVSSIGTPICTDAIASKSMFERTFGQYARVLVDLDLSQALRHSVLVERKGFAFFVDLDYENLPDFCTHCNMIGHYVEICKNLQAQEHNNKEVDAKLKSKIEKTKPRMEKKYVQINAGTMEHNKSTEIVDVDVSIQPLDGEKNQPVIVEDQVGESSKSSPVHSPASVEQQNKFSLLVDVDAEVPTEENEVVVGNDQHKNALLNNDVVLEDNIDGDSSQDSAFVDATQFQKDDVPILDPVVPPDRVQKDMIFLKQSWANIADLEDQDMPQVDIAPTVPQQCDEGFQVQLSKQQKKAQKKLSHSSKDSYATRSKVSQKPFK
jgi:hypothetical protein